MPIELLLISGSLRSTSVNSAVLRTAAAIAAPPVHATLYERVGELPHFNPDEDGSGGAPVPAVAALRQALGACDGVLFATPEYAGALPGSFKNLLDWAVEDGGLYGKPAAWVNATSRPAEEASASAYESLRAVLGYAGAEVVEAACIRVRVPRAAIGEDGLLAPGGAREAISRALDALAARVAAGRRDQALADEDAGADVRAFDAGFVAALRAGDRAGLELMLAPDFVLVGRTGRSLSRKEVLDASGHGELWVEITGSAGVHRHAGAAVVMAAGQDGAGYTHVLAHDREGWRVLAAQLSPARR